MHDLTLGRPVDVGDYMGPLLNGKPLHEGNCFDGVHGCGRCNFAMKSLSDEELKVLGVESTEECEWCKNDAHIRDIAGITDVDEANTIVYQVCTKCRKKYNDALDRESAEYGQDFEW